MLVRIETCFVGDMATAREASRNVLAALLQRGQCCVLRPLIVCPEVLH